MQTSGIQNDPAVDIVLAETGPLNAGGMSISALLGGSDTVHVRLEWVAVDDTVKQSIMLHAPAGTSVLVGPLPLGYVEQDESFRLVMDRAAVGDVQGVLFMS